MHSALHRRARRALPLLFSAFALNASLHAQGPTFDSPGQSSYSTLGQTTRFSTEFNPAFGFALDGIFTGTDSDAADDGFDLSLRLFEFNAAAYVDPKAWAYVVIAAEDLEDLTVEEAAVEYIGFESNSTLKAGRFFVDFGKQMQNHVEELRTLERPVVLREYLGEELAGTGLQFDHWLPLGDATPLRFSIGLFASLAGGEHAHGGGGEPALSTEVPPDKDIDEFSISARLTGMTDVGENSLFQLGTSVRHLPQFSLEFEQGAVSLQEEGLSNTVYGLDATFAWNDDLGETALLVGGEFLVFDGDLGGVLDNPTTPTRIQVIDDTASGYYLYTDFTWTQQSSAGIQFSSADAAEDPNDSYRELDLYYSHHLTEFRRLRFGVTFGGGERDFTRAFVQFTNFFGSHAHGLNW